MGVLSLRHPGGTGAPMLLVHGFGADHLTWSANQPALSAAADVWSLDLPGHGQTPATADEPTLDALAGTVAAGVDDAGLRSVDLVGHSLGGAIVARLAELRPDLVRSLSLIAPVGLGATVNMTFLAEYPVLTDPAIAEDLLRHLVSRPRLINRMMVSYVLAGLDTPGRRPALTALATAMPAIFAQARACFDRIATTDLPRLVIWGEGDQIHALDRPRLQAFGGNTLILPECGHMPHVEHAMIVNRLLTAFVGALAA
ncbi:alpha/beta fold hydrolase [Oryzibacter oryziterrae]|uniref:alpha/beta fold hydrolase n=1 Tax=Oryzibacter oryziterrae TaxID=2766474 RepID=UPI001F2D163F|nr:alpha/beta fold hydrolase [Oryzibacter oryziterrae]